MAESERNADIIRRYLRVFETEDLAEPAQLVAEDVLIHGAGVTVTGRSHVESAVSTPGLSHSRLRIDDLFAAGDRATVGFTNTYCHDRTGRDPVMTGVKSYRLAGGRIVEFWGETDFYGLLRRATLCRNGSPGSRVSQSRHPAAHPSRLTRERIPSADCLPDCRVRHSGSLISRSAA